MVMRDLIAMLTIICTFLNIINSNYSDGKIFFLQWYEKGTKTSSLRKALKIGFVLFVNGIGILSYARKGFEWVKC